MNEKSIDIEKYLAEQGKCVSDFLKNSFPGNRTPDVLFSAMEYSLFAPGKRIRPVLCIATAQTLGGIVDEDVMRAAASIEMIHTYSLIHDDLPCMDDDDLRRGKPTNHKVFGEAMALLAGDALLTYAFELLSSPQRILPSAQLELIRVLSRASGCFGMVGGQVADMEAEHRQGSLAELQFIHRNKTGKLIEASVEMGAILGGATEVKRKALCAFGQKIGLVFQIVDDILDVVGDAATLGKNTGVDEIRQKMTYPSLIGLKAAKALADDTMQEAEEVLHGAGINSPLLTAIGNYIVERSK